MLQTPSNRHRLVPRFEPEGFSIEDISAEIPDEEKENSVVQVRTPQTFFRIRPETKLIANIARFDNKWYLFKTSIVNAFPNQINWKSQMLQWIAGLKFLLMLRISAMKLMR